MNYYEIGQRIRKYRKACNLSQEKLAEIIGISPTHMSHIETGNTKLSLAVLVAISSALSVQIDAIIYGENQTTKTSLKQELAEIIDSCSINEANIIIEIIKSIKVSFDKHLY